MGLIPQDRHHRKTGGSQRRGLSLYRIRSKSRGWRITINSPNHSMTPVLIRMVEIHLMATKGWEFPISTMGVTISKLVIQIHHHKLESLIYPCGIGIKPAWALMTVTPHSIRIPGLMIPIHNRWVPLEGLPLRGPIEICRMIRWGMGDLAVQMWIMDHPMTHRMM